MALNINVQVKVAGDHFNASSSTRIRNDIALGDPGPNDRDFSRDDLQGDFAPLLPDDGIGRALRGTRLHDLDVAPERGNWPRSHATHPHAVAPRMSGSHGPHTPAPVPPAPHHHARGAHAAPPLPLSPPPPEGHHAPHGHVPHSGAADTDRAIRDAARTAGVDVNTMRAIASIESDMNPGSNRYRRTQYKGLYQIGRNEWRTFGEGNIYNAHDNALAAARMFAAHSDQFRAHYGRAPTDRELYMIHQQGLGFYTRGIMTNIRGNPYPGMRGPQTHQSFEAGWGRELERRATFFRARDRARQAAWLRHAGAAANNPQGN